MMNTNEINEISMDDSGQTRLLKFGFWISVLLVLIASFSQLIFGIILSIFILIFKSYQFELALLAALLANCFSFILFYLFFYLQKYDLRDVFQAYSFKLITIIPLFLAAMSLQVSGSEFDNLMRTLLPPSAVDDFLRSIHPALGIFERLMQDMALLMQFRHIPGMILLVLSASVVAPIFEEILFRGIMFTGLRRKYSLGTSLFIQAILFGLMHGNPWQFFYAFLLGILLGLLVHWSRSIYPAIILHFFINFSAVIFNNLFPTKGLTHGQQIEHVDPVLFAISIVVGIGSIVWLVKLKVPEPTEIASQASPM